MADILLRHYVIATIVFCLVIVGGINLLSIVGESDPTFTSDPKFTEFNQSFNRLNDVTNSVGQVQTGITEATTDPGTFGVLNGIINAVWGTVKGFFASFGVMTAAYEGTTNVFGVPSWIAGLAILAVIVLVGFSIYSAIFQTEL